MGIVAQPYGNGLVVAGGCTGESRAAGTGHGQHQRQQRNETQIHPFFHQRSPGGYFIFMIFS
jgi:hypothetical protein